MRVIFEVEREFHENSALVNKVNRLSAWETHTIRCLFHKLDFHRTRSNPRSLNAGPNSYDGHTAPISVPTHWKNELFVSPLHPSCEPTFNLIPHKDATSLPTYPSSELADEGLMCLRSPLPRLSLYSYEHLSIYYWRHEEEMLIIMIRPAPHFHPLVILLPRRCSLLAAARMVLVAPALKLLPKVTSFSVFP